MAPRTCGRPSAEHTDRPGCGRDRDPGLVQRRRRARGPALQRPRRPGCGVAGARRAGQRVPAAHLVLPGLGGSARPADPARVRVEDHADDARAVLDAYAVPAATLIGWSLGVNVAFELALEDPARVRAVLAVAGVPGGTFSSLFAPYGVPRRLRAPVGRLSSRLLPVVGPLLPPLAASLPPWPELLSPAALRGPVHEATHPGALRAVLQEVS